MIMLQKSYSSLAVVYFIPLVFIGAFFLLNLTLAVIKSKFSEAHNERKRNSTNKKIQTPEEINKKKEKERMRINRKFRSYR